MGQTMISIRVDEDLKKDMENICKELGITISGAFNIFARKMVREKRIPFEVSIDSTPTEKEEKPFKLPEQYDIIQENIEKEEKSEENSIIEKDEYDPENIMESKNSENTTKDVNDIDYLLNNINTDSISSENENKSDNNADLEDNSIDFLEKLVSDMEDE